MKTWILYALILTATFLFPVERADVAKLRPIEVIYIYKDAETVILKTDTDDLGIGTDVASALENMKQTSPAVIYLDTAQYLLIGTDAQQDAQQLRGIVKNSMQLCLAEGEQDLKQVAQYLPAHGKLPSFGTWRPDQKLPFLYRENARIKISKNIEKSA